MTRTLTRTNLHSSKLIRTLSDLALVDAAEPCHGFAEALSVWVDFNHAIALRTLHDASPAGTAFPTLATSETKVVARAAAGHEFARVRANLVNSIENTGARSVARDQIELHGAQLAAATNAKAAYEPFRRCYAALQRDMSLKIAALRNNMRAVLTQASPSLKTLAGLDAAFEGALSEREGKLLSTLPLLLERRFAQWRIEHQKTLASSQQEDNPALWLQPGAWLARFCHEFQTVLLAELDVRLQPTLGLLEALDNEIMKQK